jgi:hypothetical protein
LASNTHILNLAHVVSFIFNHFASQLTSMGLSIQLRKCSTWVLSNLLPRFVPPIELYCHLMALGSLVFLLLLPLLISLFCKRL